MQQEFSSRRQLYPQPEASTGDSAGTPEQRESVFTRIPPNSTAQTDSVASESDAWSSPMPTAPNKNNRQPHLSLGDHGLTRHGTLLTAKATPARAAAELKSILGNRSARLKSEAALVRVDSGSAAFNRHVTLEQAKSRARVEVDIIPQSRICVQGGYLRGHVKVVVPKATAKETPIFIAGGKIRIVGFESLGGRSKSIFYQCSAMLASVVPSLDGLYASDLDAEGFSRASEGEHQFPFALYLSLSNNQFGQAKGPLQTHSGLSLNYIAMISLKIKDEPGRRSIAHFYRTIEVWPRLDPTAILSPALRPLQATVSTNIPKMNDTERVRLTASIHRLHWVAGQLCHVKIIVDNATPKTLKQLTLSLHRTTTIFPRSSCGEIEIGSDLRQSSEQSTKQVSVAVLNAGQPGAKGHASARGWWLGIRPGQCLEFELSVMIPPDALTIPRGDIFEIEYSLCVAIDPRCCHTSLLKVMLPVRIIGFLSIDPPPSAPSNALTPISARPPQSRQSSNATDASGFFGKLPGPHNLHNGPRNDVQVHLPRGQRLNQTSDGEMVVQARSSGYRQYCAEPDDPFLDGPDELGNLAIEDDTDDVVQHAINTAGMDPGYHRFSDLYYSEDRDDWGGDAESCQYSCDALSKENLDLGPIPGTLETLIEEVAIENESNTGFYDERTKTVRPSLGNRRQSSFAERVNEKTRLVTTAFLNGDRNRYAHQEQQEGSSKRIIEDHQAGEHDTTLEDYPVSGGDPFKRLGQHQGLRSHDTEGATFVELRRDDPFAQRYGLGCLDEIHDRVSVGKLGANDPVTPPVSSTVPDDDCSQSTIGTLRHRNSTHFTATQPCSHHTGDPAENSDTEDSTGIGNIGQTNSMGNPVNDAGLSLATRSPRGGSTPQVHVDVRVAQVANLQTLSPASTTSTRSAASIGGVSVKDKVRQFEERVREIST